MGNDDAAITKKPEKKALLKPVSPKAKQEQLVFEEFLPIAPNSSSRYPGLFTTIPLFVPQADRKKHDTTGWEEADADTYYSGELRIERYGPGLSIYDEDTLIAIFQLAAERRMRGTRGQIGRRLNNQIVVAYPDKVEEVLVGNVTPYLVNKYLGRGSGGLQLKLCQESIKRLNQTQFTFYSDIARKKMSAKFFEYGAGYDPTDTSQFKIDPVMVKLLREYAEINWAIRRKLSDTGKSVQRYLSGKEAEHRIPLVDLMESIRYKGLLKEFRRVLVEGKGSHKGQLEILKDENWLLHYEITGTGRKTPLILHTIRNSEVAPGIVRESTDDHLLEHDFDDDID